MIVYLNLLILLELITFTNLYDIRRKKFITYGSGKSGWNKRYKWSFICTSSILAMFSAVRDGIGLDYIAYMRHIQSIQNGIDIYMEAGFEEFCKLIKRVSDNPRTVIVLLAIMTCLFYIKFIYSQSDNVIMSLFLFLAWGYYFLTFMSIRNYFALSLVLVSVTFLIREKYIVFILMVLLASAFHKSALFCIPIYLLACKKINKKYMIICTAMIIVCALVFKEQFRTIAFYFYPGYENSLYDTGRVSFLNVIKAVFTVALGYFYNKSFRESKRDNIFFNLNIFALICYVGFYWLPEISRIGFYMNATSIVFLPNVVNNVRGSRTRFMVKILIYSSGMVLFFILMQGFYSPTTQLLPYKTWLGSGY